MSRRPALAAILCGWLAVSALVPLHARAAAAPAGRILAVRAPAPTLRDPSRSVRIYLPPSYSNPDSGARRYPTVYLLHGWPGGDGNWPGHGRAAQTLDSLIAHGAIPEVIAVMPDGNGIGTLGRSLYVNSWDGRSRMEDYVVHDLVEWVDHAFRTRADSAHRAVIGLSDGGLGALNLAFRHPDVFNACGGHSGQYRLQQELGIRKVTGPDPGAIEFLERNSPTVYAYRIVPRLRRLVIYFDCGVRDPDLQYNRELHETLERLGVPHTYREFAGRHGWGYWKQHLRDSLIACLGAMR